jgi:hypothetical protein
VFSIIFPNSRNKEAACIVENGEHHYNAIDQTNSFTRFFDDLAIPKNKGIFLFTDLK